LALLSDLIWSKRRQMEIYLNIAEWGDGVYGIGAAARQHFKRSAKRISRRQAALLAVSLPNPKVRRPARPTRGLSRMARRVERRARASGPYIGCLKGG
ncbi:MAG: transglycosylase domain-containing protein, partial [Pseudomonadota bacterium]